MSIVRHEDHKLIVRCKPVKHGAVVYMRYRDHVLYHRSDPTIMKPQVRETVGWLVYDCADYIIIAWDRDAGPPTLKNGDPKASGLVILRGDILELRDLG
jgi:hypothetical protein